MRKRQNENAFDRDDLVIHDTGETVGAKLRKVMRSEGMYIRKRGIHALRDTFGTELLKTTGGNLRLTQEALNHAKISSTQWCTHILAEEKKKGGRGSAVLDKVATHGTAHWF